MILMHEYLTLHDTQSKVQEGRSVIYTYINDKNNTQSWHTQMRKKEEIFHSLNNILTKLTQLTTVAGTAKCEWVYICLIYNIL